MIELLDNPDAILTMEIGEHALIGGVQVHLCEFICDDLVFFTTDDSRPNVFNRLNDSSEFNSGKPQYSEYVRHVRIGPSAAVTRAELAQAIRKRAYHIG